MTTDDLSQIENQLSAYLDGELNDEERRQLERVLAENPRSRQLLAELRQTARLVGELPRANAPADLAQRITAAVEQAAPPQPRSARRIRWPLWLGTSGAVAAGLLLVMALVHFHGAPSERPETKVADRSLPEVAKPMAMEKGPRAVPAPADAIARLERDIRTSPEADEESPLAALGYAGINEARPLQTLTVTVPDTAAGATAAEWLTAWAKSPAREGFSRLPVQVAALPAEHGTVLACYRMELDPQQIGQLVSLTEQWSQQLQLPQQVMRAAATPGRGAPAHKADARYKGDVVGTDEAAEQPAAVREMAKRQVPQRGEDMYLGAARDLEVEPPTAFRAGARPVLAEQPATQPSKDKKAAEAQPVLVVIRLASPATQPTAQPGADE